MPPLGARPAIVLAILAAIFASGCRRPAIERDRAATPPAPPAEDPCVVTQRRAGEALDGSLRRIVAACDAQEKEDPKWIKLRDETLLSKPASTFTDPEPSFLCKRTRHGAWATQILVRGGEAPDCPYNEYMDDPMAGLPERLRAPLQLELVHLDSAARAAKTGFFLKSVFWGFGTTNTELWTYDFDGDGEEELVARSNAHHEGSSDVAVGVFTWKDGAVARYAHVPDWPIVRVEDATNDGRADLILSELLGGSSCEGLGRESHGVEYLAHGLPDGRFSTTDAAAKDFVRKACPRKPTSVRTQRDVECLRIYGVEAAEVVRSVALAYTSTCVPPPDPASDASVTPDPRANAEYESMLDFARSGIVYTPLP